MQAVLRLIEDRRPFAFNYRVGHFLAAAGRQAVQEHRIGTRLGEERLIHLVRRERFRPRGGFRFLAHAGPHIGIYSVRARERFGGIRGERNAAQARGLAGDLWVGLVALRCGDGDVYAVPPLRPDVAIIHAQRADAAGDTQVWGLLGCQKEAAFAAGRVLVVVEELVDEAVVRADPNRTIIPGLIVDAVVVQPFGAHPSYAQGYYDRDNRFYLDWEAISRDPAALAAWLRDWIHGTADHDEYLARLGQERLAALRPSGTAPSGTVDYGRYG